MIKRNRLRTRASTKTLVRTTNRQAGSLALSSSDLWAIHD